MTYLPLHSSCDSLPMSSPSLVVAGDRNNKNSNRNTTSNNNKYTLTTTNATFQLFHLALSLAPNRVDDNSSDDCAHLLNNGRNFLHDIAFLTRIPPFPRSSSSSSSSSSLSSIEYPNINNLKQNNDRQQQQYLRRRRRFVDGLGMVDVYLYRANLLDRLTLRTICKKDIKYRHPNNNQQLQQQQQYHQQQQQPQKLKSLMVSALLSQDYESGYTPLHSAIVNRNLAMILLLLRRAALTTTIVDGGGGRGGVGEMDIVGAVGNSKSRDGSWGNGSSNRTTITDDELLELEMELGIIKTGKIKIGKYDNVHSNNNFDKEKQQDINFHNPIDANNAIISILPHPMALMDPKAFNLTSFSSSSSTSTSTSVSTTKKTTLSTSSSSILKILTSIKDKDNLTCIDLLSQIYRNDLYKCRMNVCRVVGAMSNDELKRIESSSSMETSTGASTGCGGEFAVLGLNDEDDGNSDDIDNNYNSTVKTTNFDQGCEVMTFGKSDHFALGTPRFTNRRSKNTDDDVVMTSGTTVTDNSATFCSDRSSVQPRRVEAFGLGDKRRKCSSSSSSSSSSINGTAIQISASAHHTLVTTSDGTLYSFGLGKGGRLGTGDEHHQPLPVPIGLSVPCNGIGGTGGGIGKGPLFRKKVISCVASTNHSLCVTNDGNVYAWGSNRFGQLGISSGSSSKKNSTQNKAHCSPRRIDLLRNVHAVSVAAGDGHSIVLSKYGEVYAFGDNRAGQLGRKTSSSNIVTCDSTPSRVDALWGFSNSASIMSVGKSGGGRKDTRIIATAVAASERSTLVLAMEARSSRINKRTTKNLVYGWGHGSNVPSKVDFPTQTTKAEPENTFGSATSSITTVATTTKVTEISNLIGQPVPDPIAIACARHHNAAIMADGRVYTWGLHSEQLGCGGGGGGTKSTSYSSMVIASPRLVEGMLPRNGGGKAVAVSASESHTAVVTEHGHLYTWGAASQDGTLGHAKRSWQPVPRRVPGIHRVVGLAVAREHTALLVATTFPSLPCFVDRYHCHGSWPPRLSPPRLSPQRQPRSQSQSQSQPQTQPQPQPQIQKQTQTQPQIQTSPLLLHDISTLAVASNIDIFNVLPVLVVALRMRCDSLVGYCEDFVALNLDGILSLGKKRDLESYLNEAVSGGVDDNTIIHADEYYNSDNCNDVRDGVMHPLIKSLGSASLGRQQRMGWVEYCRCILEELPPSIFSRQNSMEGYRNNGKKCIRDGPSDRCRAVTSSVNIASITSIDDARKTFNVLTKEIRNNRKKLGKVLDLGKSTLHSLKISSDQREKLSRRSVIEADLYLLEPLLEQIEKKVRSMSIEKSNTVDFVSDFKIGCKTKVFSDENGISGREPLVSSKGIKIVDEIAVTSATTFSLVPHSKFRCEICKVTCPDRKSHELHFNGRKHRNTIRQVEEESKRKTATEMMKIKNKRALLTNACDANMNILPSNRRPSPWPIAVGKSGLDVSSSIQPRYALSPPCTPQDNHVDTLNNGCKKRLDQKGVSTTIANCHNELREVAVKVVTPPITKKSSFQQILNEEEKRAIKLRSSKASKAKLHPKRVVYTERSPNSFTHSTATSPVSFSCPVLPQTCVTSQKVSTSLPLNAFMQRIESHSKCDEQSSKPSWEGWKAKRFAKDRKVHTKQTLSDIQREEQEFKLQQDQMCCIEGGKWYVEKRVHASSLDDIQKQEEDQKGMKLFIEEQREIEAQIAKSLEYQKKFANKKLNQKQRRKKTPCKK